MALMETATESTRRKGRRSIAVAVARNFEFKLPLAWLLIADPMVQSSGHGAV